MFNKYAKGYLEMSKHRNETKDLFMDALEYMHEEHAGFRKDRLAKRIKAAMGDNTIVDLGGIRIVHRDDGGIQVRIVQPEN